MPKRNKQAKRPTDPNLLAHLLGSLSTQEPEPAVTQKEISRVMAELGRRGGRIGGKMRLETLTAEQRREFAFKAAQARWNKAKAKGKRG